MEKLYYKWPHLYEIELFAENERRTALDTCGRSIAWFGVRGWAGGGYVNSLYFLWVDSKNIFTYIYIPQDQRDVLMFYKHGFKG